VSHTTNRHQDLKAILDRLKLSGMAKPFPDLALRAAKEGLSHEAYLHERARQEEAMRQERRTERLLRPSGLPLEKTFRTFDLKRLSPTLQLQIERLQPGAFLQHSVKVVAVGKPGVGNSHVLAALGYELILSAHSVLWTPTGILVQRLLAAKRDLRLPQEVAKLDT
jgi:DNA replication protein DnaC